MSPRNIFRIVLAVAALAWFGWTWYQRHHPDTPQASAAAPRPSARKAMPAEPAKPRMYGRIAFQPCTLASPQSGIGSVEAQCGTLRVAEDPARPQGRHIDLRIAWIPADDDADVAPDPLFAISGGPGESIVDGWPGMAPAFAEVLKKRGIVLVDQRGTGKSNPLQCDLDLDAATQDSTLAATQACRDALGKRADLRFYTTLQAVSDLDAVRRALGVDQVNLYGVSYGTRVAQQYAMRQPRHVRSIVLDSVVPNTLVLGNIFARNLEHALALQFGRCGAEPACKGKLGDPRAELDTLLATLRKAPAAVEFRDASTGETRSGTLTANDVAGLVRMFAYMPAASALLPLLVHDANQGHYASLAALAQHTGDGLKDAMAMGMQLSVICSEDGDGIVPRSEDAGTVLGNTLVETLAGQCKLWPKGAIPADFHAPLRGNVPTLVLEGEYDPVTPPDYGKQVLRTLPNARLLVLRGQGHAVFGAGCMPKLMTQFIDTADAKTLDTKCLERLPYTPPFTSFNGWTP